MITVSLTIRNAVYRLRILTRESSQLSHELQFRIPVAVDLNATKKSLKGFIHYQIFMQEKF
jgi:hypothetical protein